MQALFKKLGSVTVVSLKGRMEIEAAFQFKDACRKHFANQKIVFNMSEVNFVGSTGIQSFLEGFKLLQEQNKNIVKMTGVHSDLKRMFDACNLSDMSFYQSENEAVLSFEEKESFLSGT